MRLPTWHVSVLSLVVMAIGLLIGLSVGLAGVATAAASGAVLSPRFVDARVPVAGSPSGQEGIETGRTGGCRFVAPPAGQAAAVAAPSGPIAEGRSDRLFAVCEGSVPGPGPVEMPALQAPASVGEAPLNRSR